MSVVLAAWRWLRIRRAEHRCARLIDRASCELIQQRTREMRELVAAARAAEWRRG